MISYFHGFATYRSTQSITTDLMTLVMGGLFLWSCGHTGHIVPTVTPLEEVHFQQTLTLDSTKIQVRVIAERLMHPWEICWGPDHFLWVTDHHMIVARINPESGQVIPLQIDDPEVRSDTSFIGPLGNGPSSGFS